MYQQGDDLNLKVTELTDLMTVCVGSNHRHVYPGPAAITLHTETVKNRRCRPASPEVLLSGIRPHRIV